jgi:hypothetical protein
MIWMAFLHHFGLVLILLGVYTVFFVRDFRSLLEQPLKIVYAMVSLGLVFWVSFLAAKLTAKQVILATFGYPLYRLYEYFFSWFVQGWPVFLVFVAFGSALLLARFISDRSARAPLFVLGAIYIPAVLTSFALPHYVEARYTFHLYPLMVLVFSTVAIEAGFRLFTSLIPTGGQARKLKVAIVSLAALFISQDANPVHAWSVGNRNYQSPRDPIRSVINWDLYAGFHQDHKNPALYIRQHLLPTDRILALGPPHTLAIYHFYVGQVHYALAGPRDFNYHQVARGGKVVAFITGSEILQSLASIKEVMEELPQGRIWLVGDRLLLLADNPSYPNHIQKYLRSFAYNPDYLGLDGQTFAVKLR